MPLTDIEIDLWNDNRDYLNGIDVCLCIPPKQGIDIIRDKFILEKFIAGKYRKINSVETKRLIDIKELEWAFPVVCKPYNGRSSQGLRITENEIEWKSFLMVAQKEKYLVQPKINGICVMVEIVRNPTENKTIAITRKSLLNTSTMLGISAYIYSDKELETDCKKLAENLDIIGCVNFEFILTPDGNYYLLECNPRFSAGVKFSCMAGYDCIINHLRCFKSEPIDDFEFKKPFYAARKYVEYITKNE